MRNIHILTVSAVKMWNQCMQTVSASTLRLATGASSVDRWTLLGELRPPWTLDYNSPQMKISDAAIDYSAELTEH